jgi:hypothetical protein
MRKMDENTQFVEYDEVMEDAWGTQAEIEMNDLYIEMKNLEEI